MKKYFSILIVLLFGIVATANLLHAGFAVTHDGQDHIARIANFYLNLQEGIIIPRWAANLNWGYGHPILEFLYPFPSYAASFFHFLGFSFINATKFVFVLSMIASGLTMYFFAKTVWGEKAGIVSGVLYMYAPYRFVDLYVRGDIGEHVAFVFIPLVLLGMYTLSQKSTVSKLSWTAISLALLILSHNAIALMVVPLILLYALYLSWQKKWNKKLMLFLGGSMLFGFLLSCFFWVPALFEGQYTLRNIVTKGEYVTRFVTFSQLLYGQWNYGQTGEFSVQLGITEWIMFVVSAFFTIKFWKKEKALSLLAFGLIVSTIVAIFFMLPQSNFLWSKILLLQNFQFPWRFLAIPVVTTAILGGYVVRCMSSKYQTGVVVLVLFSVLLLSIPIMHAKAYMQKDESFFTGIYNSTTDTGESSPIWSVRFMLHRFDKPLEVISGSAKIIQESRLVTRHTYTVSSQGKSRLLENTLYFPGWRIKVDGRPVAVQFQEPKYRGLMTFFVADGTHEVVVSYHESKIRVIGDTLSLIGIFSLVGLLFITRKKI
ncbi:MAG TPA: 6-pyruvoyl-tetrahydropterin synthase-related protein [Patescibacteria group bacterium]|nr:6-pyruvoyl-tetrahydropterin synthase-related protein [Patescibacteria group bacterium]